MSDAAVAFVATLVWASSTTTDGAGTATSQRWDPPWLLLLVGVAVVLVTLAVLWWLFLIVRVQDTFRDDTRWRRRR